MSAHLTDELPGLLSGEATRDAVLAAAEHLRTCIDCQQELVSAVVAHASLRSAQRFAPEVVARRHHGDEPHAASQALPDLSAVFAQIRREVDADGGADDIPRAHETDYGQTDFHSDDVETDDVEHADDLEHVDDLEHADDLRRVDDAERTHDTAGTSNGTVRRIDSIPRRSPTGRRGVREHRLLAVAAAAVVLAGGTAVVTVLATRDDSSSTSGGRTVALAAFGQGRTGATATIKPGAIQINATSLPTLANRRYEVWLTDAGRTRMQPVGWVGNDGWAKLSVPRDLVAQYDDLEVSVQNPRGSSYDYSGTSVLRGSIS